VPHKDVFFDYAFDNLFKGLVDNHKKFDLVPFGHDLGTGHDTSTPPLSSFILPPKSIMSRNYRR
jgi:hypothetical protein